MLKVFRNIHQRDVDFAKVKEERDGDRLYWYGYWILRSSGKIIGTGMDRIKINKLVDWTELINKLD